MLRRRILESKIHVENILSAVDIQMNECWILNTNQACRFEFRVFEVSRPCPPVNVVTKGKVFFFPVRMRSNGDHDISATELYVEVCRVLDISPPVVSRV